MKKLFKFLIAVFLGFSLVSCVRTADSVTLNKETLTLEVGQSETLTATVAPEKLSDLELVWATSDLNVAEVVNGKVTAKKAGTATITVYAHYGEESEKKDTCTVTVKDKVIAVTGVTFHADTDSVYMGSTLQMTAVVAPSNATNKAVTWKSSNEAVATVDGNGLVTPVKTGTTTITVTTVDGSKTDTCEVTVLQLATGIVLDKETHTLNVGEDVTLVATVNPDTASNKEVGWETSDATIATVENGKVVAVKAGKVTITASTANGTLKDTCEITVLQPVTGVTLDSATLTLDVGEDTTLVATVEPADASNKEVTWASSNEEVATVVNGKVTAVAKGEATITVTTKDGSKTASCTVTVLQPVTGVSFAQTSGSVVEGETKQLAAVVAPANASNPNVTWSSENEEIATVDENGLITGVAVGTTTITVTTVDGNKTATYTITVVADAIPTESITVSAPNNETEIKVDENLQLTATVTPADTTDSLTWSSSDETVATVNSSGLVTAKKAGNVTITATSGSKSATYDLEIVKHDNSIANIETITVTYGDTYNVTVGTPVYGTPVVVYLAEGSLVPLLEKPTNAGTYSVVVNIAGNDKYNDFTKAVGTIVINKKAIAKPAQDTTNFVYTGEELTYTVAENAGYTVSDNTTQTNAGSYDVVITLDSNHIWDDETTDALTYKFVIARTNPTLTVEDLEVELGDEIEVVYQTNSNGTVTIKYYQGDEEVTPDAAGTYKVVVTIAEATNYNSITAEAELVVVISTTSLEVDKTTVNLEVAAEEAVTITRLPQDTTDELTISSTDEEIAKIENGKVVAGKKDGTATITITSGEFTKTITVTVTNPWGTATDPITVERAIELLDRYNTKTYSPVKGYVKGVVTALSFNSKYSSYTLTLAEEDADVEFLVYSANLGENVPAPVVGATVVASGWLVNYDADTYEVAAVDNVYPTIESATFNITTSIIDKNEQPTDLVEVDLPNSAAVGSTVEFTVVNENSYTVVVYVNGTEIKEENGEYSFVINSDTTVQILAIEGEVEAESITIIGDERLALDLTTTLLIVKEPWYATEGVTWSSGDETIATVSAGVVTPLKEGNVTITATTASGKTDTHTIEVYNRWGKEDAPISVETALAQIDTLNGAYSIGGYVTGVVSSTPSYNATYGSYTFEIVNVDTLTSTKTFKVYSGQSDTAPVFGDIVVVSGSFVYAYSTYEVTYYSSNNIECKIESITHNEYDYTVSYLDAEGAPFEGDVTVTGLDGKVAYGTNVTFTVSAPANHYVKSVSLNDEEITAVDGEYSFTSELINDITIVIGEVIAIEEVVISGETSVEVDGKITLTAVVTPSNAKVTNIVWSTENTENVSVIGNGLTCEVEGLLRGAATIKFDCEELAEPVEYAVTVTKTTSKVSVATFDFGANGDAEHADGGALEESVTYEDNAYSLVLSNNAKVYTSRDQQGNSCIKLGTSSVVGSFSFEVPEDVTEVIIYVAKYKTYETEVVINGSSTIINTSSNDGEYTPIKIDTTTTKTITFATASSSKARCMINTIEFIKVMPYVAPTSLTLGDSTLDLLAGDSYTLEATIEPAEATETNVVWTTNDEEVATVKNGVITAVGVGQATITAKLEGLIATCVVNVSLPELATITLNKTTATLGVGDSLQLTASANPSTASLEGLVWSSNNASATVDQTGKVTAVSAGEATITATVGDVSATCSLTIIANAVKTTVTTKISEYAASNGWANSTQYETLVMDENITITIGNVGQNSSKYYSNGENWRMYQGESPTIDFTALNGKTIISVIVTYTVSNTGVLTLGDSQVASGSLVEVNASTISFGVGNTGSATNGQVRITQIEVVYQ